MKTIFTLTFLFISSWLFAQSAYINEFHYDNDGVDVGEFIEVAVQTGYSCPTGLQIIYYNGSNGQYYHSQSISSSGTTVAGGTLYVVTPPSSTFQNGPDGIALVCGSSVLQFISYEGSFTATNGVANGMTSQDVGVSESNTAPINSSLYFSNGSWFYGDGSIQPATPGALNPLQTTLPVALKFFSAVLDNHTAVIQWEAAQEDDVQLYTVQWSKDAENFSSKTSIRNTASGIYSIVDEQLANGANFYRLEIAHVNGDKDYSGVIRLFNHNHNPNASLKVLENPVQNNQLVFSLSGFEYTPNIIIIDAIGKVYRFQISGRGGEQKIDISQLAPGTYFLKASDATATKIVRFVK